LICSASNPSSEKCMIEKQRSEISRALLQGWAYKTV